MNWDDGCKYDGDWKDDVRHGKGYLNIPTVINMKATGRMIFNMEKVLITFTRVTVMKDHIF